MLVATSPWRTLAHKGGTLEAVSLVVDQRDPAVRMILNPITDDASRVVGIAGMILDEDYFRTEVLPRAIKELLPEFFGGDPRYAPVVFVRNGHGEKVLSTDPKHPFGRWDAGRHFSFVFTDWKVELVSRHATPVQVARRNFLLNLGLSAALAATLLGGIVLALRTASREMKLSEMKNDFVSNVSHELRTPLASIRVFGEFLRLGRVDSPEKIARIRRVHRDREPAPDPAHQQPARLREHRVGPQELPLRAAWISKSWSPRP